MARKQNKTTWLMYAQVPLPQKKIKRQIVTGRTSRKKIPGRKGEGGGKNIKGRRLTVNQGLSKRSDW